MTWLMDNDLNPDDVVDRVTRAHMTLAAFLVKAKVGNSSFYRWRNGEANLSRVSMQKVRDALSDVEAKP